MSTRARPSPPDEPDLVRAQLEPVRRALLDEAADEARRIVDEASAAADASVDAARAQAEDEVARADARRAAADAAYASAELTRRRAEARARVLEHQAELHRRLVEACRAAAWAMRQDDRYPVLLDRLEAMARDQLGAEAVVERDPDGWGGVVASAAGRRVDYRLATLAERALAALGDDVPALWESAR